MADIEIAPAVYDHVHEMNGRFTDINEEEAWALGHMTCAQAVEISVMMGERSWTIFADGVPVGSFGVIKKMNNPHMGTAWMAATNEFKEHGARIIVRQAKKYLEEMFNGFSILEAWVFKKNKLTARWLEWCGFKKMREYDLGPDSKPFVNYRLRKEELDVSRT